ARRGRRHSQGRRFDQRVRTEALPGTQYGLRLVRQGRRGAQDSREVGRQARQAALFDPAFGLDERHRQRRRVDYFWGHVVFRLPWLSRLRRLSIMTNTTTATLKLGDTVTAQYGDVTVTGVIDMFDYSGYVHVRFKAPQDLGFRVESDGVAISPWNRSTIR